MNNQAIEAQPYLKPCPFCHNPDVKLRQRPDGLYYVECNIYACSRPYSKCFYDKDECIKDWNESE